MYKLFSEKRRRSKEVLKIDNIAHCSCRERKREGEICKFLFVLIIIISEIYKLLEKKKIEKL